ncbi:hypothetical protein DH2020_002742 [Rehmannia glutinosa]|uniref:Disease resistance protein RPM1-like n=1 Tax=Rehmannia glutinosa TaxID=99300 RepID=A0ABR0XV35_REHGL
MAECAVGFVLDKITTLLDEKVNLIKDVKKEIEYVRDELERMTAFLRVADAAEDSDPELKVWVKQVRDVAYETEDIVDEFMLQLHSTNGCGLVGCCGFLDSLIFSVGKLKTQYEIASEIQSIKSRMTDIAVGHRRYRYKFSAPNQSSSLSGNGGSAGGVDRRGDALLLEEGELVGIENPKKQLVTWLVEGVSRLKVVAVAGMGGLGKTTLVKKVYDDSVVKKYFHNHAWITVSQSFKLEELLRDTIHQLFDQMKMPVPQEMSTMNGSRLKAIIKDFLRQRSVETDGYVYQLNPLSEEESWILFCQKAFNRNSCPNHLIDICDNILRRCGGLPLAIVAISGVLSTKKEMNIDEWKMLNYGLGSELEANDQLESMRNILLLSFNYLPYYLKPCFMYLSNYPEDHLIEHNVLVRQWIAEGFVRRKEGRTVEQVAQGYLNELINRSLLRPVKTNDDGSVKISCIHDFYREIILSKSRDQNFATTTIERNMAWPKRVRRLSIHGALENSEVERYGARLCSLLSFGVIDSNSISSILHLLKISKMLKVLDLTGLTLENFPEVILELLHLRYLCLRNTRIKRLPDSIKNLQKLEMLDLKGTFITELPVGILKLQYLCQLLVYRHLPGAYMPYNYVHGFKALKGIGCLKSLQKLCFIEVYPGSRVLKEIATLTELKRISITKLSNEDCVVLCSAIEYLDKLSSLGLRALEGEILDLQYLHSPPPFLQRLYLGGQLAMFPHWIQSLRSLVKVYLRWSRLRDDPLEYLQDLPNLVHIEFLEAYIGEKLCFKAGKFQKLKLLGLDKLEVLKVVIIEEGATPLLEKLIIQRCKMLENVPVGIERLSNLKVLEFFDMPDEFIFPLSPEKSGDQYWKVAHIPEVYHTYWRNDCWEVYTLEDLQANDKSGKPGNTVVKTHEQRNWLRLLVEFLGRVSLTKIAKLMLCLLRPEVAAVAEIAAVGFGLQKDAFISLMKQESHLLASTGSDLRRHGQIGTVFAGYHYDLNFLTIHGRSRFPGLNIWLRNGQNIGSKSSCGMPPHSNKEADRVVDCWIVHSWHARSCD